MDRCVFRLASSYSNNCSRAILDMLTQNGIWQSQHNIFELLQSRMINDKMPLVVKGLRQHFANSMKLLECFY